MAKIVFMKTALLVGASGLVGGFVLNKLLDDAYFSAVTVLSRTPVGIKHPKLSEIIVNFDKLENYQQLITADVVFCTLGTTINKAGSQEAFKKVDYEYPLQIATFAKQNGATSFLIISALGASTHSLFFYNKVKGAIEDAIAKLNFKQFHILQPSLIIGNRKEKRTGEDIAQKLSPIFNSIMIGNLGKYKAITAEQIAKAMVYYAKQDTLGTLRHHSGELQKI